jgi:geranylgeranyl reductase family protein
MATTIIHAKVAIIGAGPGGTAAAAHLGQLGVRNVVLVDRHDFPRDKTCGSGISPRGIEALRKLGVWGKVEPHATWIDRVRLVTAGGRESTQSAGVEAIICKRRIFDQILLETAVDRGVRFLPNFTASTIENGNGRVNGFSSRDGRTVYADHVLVAGGCHCRVGANPGPERKTIKTIMGWWEDVPFTPGQIDLIFDKDIAPYYGWLFPEDEKRVNIGITFRDEPNGKKRNARELFARFLHEHYADKLTNARQIGALKGHPVAFAYRFPKLVSPGALIVGEAGSMTNPATAEGIWQAMHSGMLAAEAVADVISGRRDERAAYLDYQAACKRAFLPSFWASRLFLAVADTKAFDWLVALGDVPVVRHAASKLLAAI